MVALELHGVSVRLREQQLIRDVSLRLDAGQPLTLLGETGSGKTLLLQSIMGNLPAGLTSSGQVSIWGGKTAAWGTRICLLPQEPWTSLDPIMRSVKQVSEVYRQVAGLTAANAATRTSDAFRRLNLAGAEGKLPRQLSGGMAQRVAFAAVRAGGAQLLLADEPTKGLDAAMRESVVGMLRAVVAEGGAVLTITHDIAVARLMGGNVAVMLDGAIVEEGRAANLLTNPQHEYTRRLLAAEPAAWPQRHPTRSGGGSAVVVATALSKRFDRQQLFTDLSLEIAQGERLAIAGASGSGKTTLGNILVGLVPQDAGSVVRAGGSQHPWKFQKLYQDPIAAFAPAVSLRTALADVVGLHGVDASEIPSRMGQLRLAENLLDRRPSQVSGGELQRFALLRALLVRPKLIFADEATSRLDPITQQQTMDLLLNSAEEMKAAVLLVTHDADIASRSADRILNLN